MPLGSARNLALEKCDGNWIAFLDSDDFWDHNFLSDQMSALAGKESSTFGYGFVTEFLENSSDIKNYGNIKKETSLEEYISKKLLKGNFIYFSSLVFSSEALRFLKCFEEDFVQAEDYELLLRLSHKFKGLQTGRVYYRLHQNNLSKSQTSEMYLENLEILGRYLKNKMAKISYSYNIAQFALFCIKNWKFMTFANFINSRKYSIFYVIPGCLILLTYRVVRISKTIGKKL